MTAQYAPKRPQANATRHYSTLLKEVKNLSEKLDSLLSTVASVVRAELENHDNKKCLAIYGIPENEDQVTKVNTILACAFILPHQFTILHRLGKPRLDGSPRPLKIKLLTYMPRPIDLSAKLSIR